MLDDWLDKIETGRTITVVADAGDGAQAPRILGYGSLRWRSRTGRRTSARSACSSARMRAARGSAARLTEAIFAQALDKGIEKMVAQMTIDQKGAIATFEELGFKAEALLRDHVKDRAGEKHDLLVYAHDVAELPVATRCVWRQRGSGRGIGVALRAGRRHAYETRPLREHMARFQRSCALAPTGFIDHIGLGVPDLTAAKRYYDELMPVLGLKQWFKTTDGSFNYGPDGGRGTQLFFYQALEAGDYSQHRPGLQHIAFVVASRAIVREAYEWARARDAEILHEPREFPEYGQHYATFWLDPHGFKLEAVCFGPDHS